MCCCCGCTTGSCGDDCRASRAGCCPEPGTIGAGAAIGMNGLLCCRGEIGESAAPPCGAAAAIGGWLPGIGSEGGGGGGGGAGRDAPIFGALGGTAGCCFASAAIFGREEGSGGGMRGTVGGLEPSGFHPVDGASARGDGGAVAAVGAAFVGATFVGAALSIVGSLPARSRIAPGADGFDGEEGSLVFPPSGCVARTLRLPSSVWTGGDEPGFTTG
jgi:hypothetical protein